MNTATVVGTASMGAKFLGALVLTLKVLIYLFLMVMIGLFLMGIYRKFTARVQYRVGPPIWQPYIDVIKLLSKKDAATKNWVFDLGVIMGLGGPLALLLFLPLDTIVGLNFHTKGDLILILYLAVVGPLGFALAASVGASPWGAIGVGRALSMMLGYELPFILGLLAVVAKDGTLLLQKVSAAQSMWNPTGWHYFQWPLILAAIGAHIALQGVMSEKPFDQAIAPHEIASGIMVEFGGKYLGMMLLMKAASLMAELGLFAVFFLGGTTAWDTIVKIFALFIIAISFDAVLGRFRPDQAFTVLWKWPTIIALLGLLLTVFA
ncbi:respiratory chain complex I subunit 1 family protein [Zhurongbacter thermophilus]